MTDPRDMNFFRGSLGADQGRLISDIPRKKWSRIARKAILDSENGEVAKKRLAANLDALSRDALFKRNTVPNVATDIWMDHALAAHADRPFRAILTDTHEGDEAYVFANDTDFAAEPLWAIPIDMAVDRTTQMMIEAIRPMLDCAREVVLIDRNFDPDKYRWRPFLEELALFLSRRTFSPSINKIAFHIGDHFGVHHVQGRCTHHFGAKIPAGMRIEFHIWPKDDLHDRYVLTDIGGARFGVGLDIHDGSGQTAVEINRISAETHRRWWGRCKSRAATFII
ncbi:MAG: hypothetical protein JEZ11_09800 [Desulfobacterales bacterium]|nr:hypothetical protein [Desulfobacterales bacterium]